MSIEGPFFILILARLSGFFLLSPLFTRRAIPVALRLGLTVIFSLFLALPLFATASIPPGSPLAWAVVKELMVGYFMGFLVSLILEGAALAGQVVGTISGFSATELLDPLRTSTSPLLSRLFSLLVVALLLALDLHHIVLAFLAKSLSLFPPLTAASFSTLLEATASLFVIALEYAAVPLLFLSMLFILFAFSARFLPNLQIFWVGFPLQLLVGIGTLLIAFCYFTDITLHVFLDWMKRLLTLWSL